MATHSARQTYWILGVVAAGILLLLGWLFRFPW
jgi:hypothetical protein